MFWMSPWAWSATSFQGQVFQIGTHIFDTGNKKSRKFHIQIWPYIFKMADSRWRKSFILARWTFFNCEVLKKVSNKTILVPKISNDSNLDLDPPGHLKARRLIIPEMERTENLTYRYEFKCFECHFKVNFFK